MEDLVKSISYEDAEKIKGNAISAFLEGNLNEDDLLSKFKIEIPTLTRETVNQASASEEKISEFLNKKPVRRSLRIKRRMQRLHGLSRKLFKHLGKKAKKSP
jgi:cell division ATPase FtsA